MFCPTCGQPNGQGAVKCTNCGSDISHAPPQPKPSPTKYSHVVNPVFPTPRSSSMLAVIVIVAIIVILAAMVIPSYLPQTTYEKVVKVKSDMRSMANALDDYYNDHKAYPPSNITLQGNMNAGLAEPDPDLNHQTTFSTPALTTPVAYLTALYPDPFAKVQGAVYSYASIHSADNRHDNWILWSPGPDRQYDLTQANIAATVQSESQEALAFLIAKTYDPSNGTTSRGDVWRMKQ